MQQNLSRRQMLACAGAGLGAGAASVFGSTVTAPAAEVAPAAPHEPFRYCLNTGTIRGFKLPFVEEVELAAQAGYTGIEPWLDNVNRYVETGGSLPDLKKRLGDRGLTVEGAIGFPAWAIDDDAQRAKNLEQLRRDMDTLAQLGGRRIAVPPAGINNQAGLDLRKIAERYRTVLELGRQAGVVPQLEIWARPRRSAASARRRS